MNFEFRDILAAGTLVVTIILAFIGQKIQNTAQKIEGKMDQHIAIDDLRFSQINAHFESTDSRIDRMENKGLH